MIKALLFDFDGVLAETLPDHFYAWQQVLIPLGIEPDDLTLRLSEGSPAYKIAIALAAHQGLKISEELAKEYAAKKNQVFRARTKAPIYPGILELITFAQNHSMTVGLVTGTAMANIRAVLPAKLLSNFDTIVTDQDTQRGKPNPDPYLKAAENLQISPRDCLVVENAPLGIQSAKAAGAFCVGLTTTLPREHLQGADVICRNHFELLQRMPELKG